MNITIKIIDFKNKNLQWKFKNSKAIVKFRTKYKLDIKSMAYCIYFD